MSRRAAGTTLFEQPRRPSGAIFWRLGQFVRPTFLANSMAREANNYDLLRLVLSLAVIFGHASALAPRPGYVDPVGQLLGFEYSSGLAVKVFFFISGLFVTDSIVASGSALRFALMRVSRLFPGLLVCLAVSTLIVGPLFTELPVADYLRNPLTLSYIDVNLALTGLQWRLPGVFADSRYGVNGSLWTIPTEARLYLVVLALHLLGTFTRRLSASLAIGLAGYLALAHPQLLFNDSEAQGVALCFLAGMAVAIHQRALPLTGLIALIASLCVVAGWDSARGHPVFYGAVFYSLLYVFQLPVARRLRLPGDFSYGIYLYGFVVQQCFVALFPSAHPLINALISMLIAISIAIPSWFLIERPALTTARRFLAAADSARLDPRAARSIAAWAGAAATAFLLPGVLPLVPGFFSSVVPSLDLRVVSYGPIPITHSVAFNVQPDGWSAIWVKMSRPVAPDTEIRLGPDRLDSVVFGDLVTARVPKRLYAAAGTVQMLVVEQVRGRMFAAEALPWKVR